MPKFKNCLVITNSASTNSKRGLRLAKKLDGHFSPKHLKWLDISGLTYGQLERQLAKQTLSEHSLVCIIGGDGTVSHVINALLMAPGLADKARQAAVLPLWGGNANDLSHMLNGAPSGVKLEQALRHGQVVAIKPLAVRIKWPGLTDKKLAVCYASFGVSALAAELVNQPGYRHMRMYHLTGARLAFEMSSGLKALAMSKPFKAEIGDSQRKLYDLMLVNGSRMAKLERFPIKLTDPVFVEMTMSNKLLGLAIYVVHALDWRRRDRTRKTERSITVRDPIWVQLDGEVTLIPADTTISVRLNEQPFYALSTRLKNQ